MGSPFLLVRMIKTHSQDLQSDEGRTAEAVSQWHYRRQANFLLSKTTAYYSDNKKLQPTDQSTGLNHRV